MKSSELLRILKKDGWYEKRQKGSHIIMIHPTKTTFLVVPNHGSAEVARGLEKDILKKAGLN
ncbi:MAG: type II toxin-antitoxin system HicA family toxin [Sphingobacteriales bacterium]